MSNLANYVTLKSQLNCSSCLLTVLDHVFGAILVFSPHCGKTY